MKLRELFFEDSKEWGSWASNRESPRRVEGPQAPKTFTNPNYTPGKAALDQEYKEAEEHTNTTIPYKQKCLNDPRN